MNKSNTNNTSVTCLTRHLTSFAVLVSTQDPDERPVRGENQLLIIKIYFTIAIYS